MSGKQYPVQELVNPTSGHSLVVDTSNGLSQGPISGLKRFAEAALPILPRADGTVNSPGQLCRLVTRTLKDAALTITGN